MVDQVPQPSIDQFRSSIISNGGLAKPSRFLVNIVPPPIIQQFAPQNAGSIPLSNYFNFNLISQFGSISSDALGGYGGSVLMLITESASLPGITLATQDVKIYGPSRKQPYQRTYGDFSCSFLVSNTFQERSFFDFWIEAINPAQSFDFNYPNDYTTQITVYQFDEGGSSSLDPFNISSVLKYATQGIATGASFINNRFAGIGGQFGDPETGIGGNFAFTGPLASSNVIYQANIFEAFPISVNEMELDWGADGFHRLQVTFAYRYWSNEQVDEDIANILPAGVTGIFPGISGVLGGSLGNIQGLSQLISIGF